MPNKKGQKGPFKGISIIPGMERAMSGAGPRRDKTLLDAERKALGLDKKKRKPRKK